MFTLEQIKAAHAKVKSGADFPDYVQEIGSIGVNAYEHYVSDGHIQYFGEQGFSIDADAKWPVVVVSAVGSAEALRDALRIHQGGGTDYSTFCAQAAVAGVDKWIVDVNEMTCTYYDQSGAIVLVEEIPVTAMAKE